MWKNTNKQLPSKCTYYIVKGGIGSPQKAYWNGHTFIIENVEFGCITHWK